MYAKLVNGCLKYASNILRLEDVTIVNPPAEELIKQGYKEVVETACPAWEEGYNWEASWEEDDETITRVWTKVEMPVYEPPVDEATEFFNVLKGAYDE